MLAHFQKPAVAQLARFLHLALLSPNDESASKEAKIREFVTSKLKTFKCVRSLNGSH